MHRLIISFYDNFGAAHNAVTELVEQGFRQDSISLIAHKSICERIWVGDRSKSWFFSSQPSKFHFHGIGPILVSGFLTVDLKQLNETEPMPLVCALERLMIPQVDAHAYTEGVRRKGILVIVRAESTNSSRALSTLDRYCPVDIQSLEEQWRKAGWTHFDDTARPLADDGLNWPACITSLPGDDLLNDGELKNWPQNIVKPWKNLS